MTRPKGLLKPDELNRVDVRAAMGLPPTYTMGALDRDSPLLQAMEGSLDTLMERVRDMALPATARYLAGVLLGLLGDPRVTVESPDMVDIPGGSFLMGLDSTGVDRVLSDFPDVPIARKWILKETPRWAVEVGPFRLARYPVTNAEYHQFLLDCPDAPIPTSWTFGRMPNERANQPVYSVPLRAARQYAVWLKQKTGRPFRLPIEVEWEWAATGGDDREYPWGNTWDPGLANTAESQFLTTTPVGMFPLGSGPFGNMDLGGNVEELVDTYYAPYPGSPWVHDDLATHGPYPVTRGGCFTRFRDLCRCRRRHGYLDHPLYAIGFRLAEDIRPADERRISRVESL